MEEKVFSDFLVSLCYFVPPLSSIQNSGFPKFLTSESLRKQRAIIMRLEEWKSQDIFSKIPRSLHLDLHFFPSPLLHLRQGFCVSH